MSLQLPFGVAPVNPVPVDAHSGPYTGVDLSAAVASANSSIASGVRFQSMEVRIVVSGVSHKYWYNSGTTNADLTPFSVNDNTSYISAVSGNLQSQITSNDSDITTLQTATGVLRTDINNNDTDIAALQTATGNLDTRVTQNASNISASSGHLQGQITSNDGDITTLQTATGVLRTDINNNDTDIAALQTATGNLDTRVTQNASNISASSGHLQTQITSNDSDITALQTATGNLDTRVTQNASDIDTVSGLIVTNSADSGIELVGSTFIMGGTGSLDKLNITSIDSNQVPLTIKGAAAQAERLQEWQDSSANVVAYIDKDGNALFSGLTALGDLDVSGTLTFIHSTNVTIADKQLELASNSGSAISGDAYIDQGGIVLKSINGDKEWIWRDSTDAWTASDNIDVGSNSVIFDGISQTIAYTGQETNVSGYINTVSGNLQSQITSNDSDITALQTATGVLRTDINNNDTDIAALQTATGNLDTRVTQNASNISAASGHLQTQITSNDSDITTLQTATGVLRTDIDSNDTDITALQTATGVLRTDINNNDTDIAALQTATGNLDTRVTQNASNISAASGHLQTQITSNDSDITTLQTATGVLRTDIDSNDTDIAALQTATGNLDTRVTQNASNISSASGHLQTQITSNDSDITTLQTATGVLRTDIDSNDTDITALQTATGVLRTDIDSNDTDITALQTATGVLRTDIDSNDTDITALQTATGVLRTDIDSNDTDITALQTATGVLRTDINNNDTDIAALQTATGNLDTRVTQNASNISAASGHLQTQITSNDSDITTLQTATGVLRTDIYSNDTDITALQTATGNLDTRVTQNASNISAASGHLQGQITSNDSDITTLQTATGVLRTDINNNDTDIAALQTATGNLDTRVTQNASNISAASGHLQGQITSNDSDITTLQTATGVLRTDINNNDTDIAALQTATGNLDTRVIQNASDVATASGHLQTQITANDSDINTVSGLLYNNWNVNVTGNSDSITSNQTVTFTGAGLSDVSYNSSTNTVTISGQGGGGTMDSWNLAVNGDATAIGDGETVDFTGQGDISISRDGNTVKVSGASQDLSSYATTSYVNTVSGNLQSQITLNDTDINIISGVAQGAADDVTIVSGIAQGAASDVATASGHLQTQITSNDSDITTLQTATGVLRTDINSNDTDITALQTATGVLRTDINSNDTDITALQTATGVLRTDINSNDTDITALQTATGNLDTRVTQNASNVTIVSGIAQGAASDVATASGDLQTQITSNDSDITTLQTATGVLRTDINSNDTDITALQTATGVLRTDINSNDTDITALQTATGVLRTDIDSNDTDITALQTATGVLRTDINNNDTDIAALQTATGNLDTRVTQNASNISASSGHLQGQITSNDSDITTLQTATGVLRTDINNNDTDIAALQTATGNLDTRVTQNASNVTIVSGIAQGAATDVVTVSGLIPNFTADSGIDLIGSTFVMGGTGNLDQLNVTSISSSQVPLTIKGAAAQSANLQEWQNTAGSTLAYVDSDGNAMFSGIIALGDLEVSGELTYISSTNVTIVDKQLELASNSGSAVGDDSHVDQGGIVLKSTNGDKEWIWRSATDSWTTNKNINVGSNAVIFDGISQTIAYTGQLQDLTGYATTGSLNIVSGIAQGAASDVATASGHLQTQITSNDSDITALQTATGVLRTDINSNDTDITALQTATGVLRTDINSNDTDITALQTATGVLRTDIDSNDTDITALQTATGVLRTDINNNDTDIAALQTATGVLRTDINSNDTDITALQTATGVLRTDINNNDTDIAALQTATGNLDTRVTQNASNVTIVSGIAQGAASDVATASGDLQTQITSNDSDITTLQTATGVLRTDINSNDTDITALQTATGVLRTDIDSNDTDITALQTATGVLRTDINNNDTDIAALQTATGVLRTDINSNDTDITALQTATGVLRTDINNNDTDIAALQTATGVLRTDINSNDTDITALQTATGNLDTRVTQNANDIDTVSGVAYKTFVVTNNGSSDYTFDGMGLNSENDPTIYLHKGHTYYFDKQIASHPFRISATDGGSVYQDADGNNIEIGGQGILKFEVPQNAPDKLYYFCTSHPSSMKGEIYTTIDIDNITSASGHLQGQITSNDTDITALQTATGVLRTDINSNDTDIATLQTATGNLDTRVTQNASNISAASGHLQTQITSNDSDITALQTATGVLRTDIDSNDTDITALQTATGVLRTDINNNDTDITALQTATGVLRTDINNNDTDITALQTATGVLRTDINNNDTDIAALQTATGNLDTRVTQNANDIDTVSGVAYKTFAITNNGSSDYVFDGMGLNSATDPDIYLHKGHTYYFDKQIASHPFRISATDGGSVYQDADGNNIEIGGQGVLKFEVPQDAPDKLYYFCTSHPSSMKGEIYTTISIDDITNASGHLQTQITSNDTDITVLQTATGNLDTRVTQNTSNISTASGDLQGQITSNDSDITILQTATGVLRTDINNNDTDIAALQAATGNLDTRVTQNASNISTSSGDLQGQITSNDSDITILQTATGNLDTRVTQNASNISAASGHLQTQITSNYSDIATLQTATGVLRTDINNNDTDISTVSGLLYNHWIASDGSTSGAISTLNTLTFSESGTTSIAFDSGTNTLTIGSTGAAGGGGTNWNLSVEGNSTNIGDGETVDFTGQGGVTLTRSSNSVIISGGGTTYTAGSGLVLDGNEFNVHGGSGNFQYVEFKSSSQDPQLYFLGSGSNDTPITLNVLSSFQSASSSGSALVFDGTEGQLFGITDNLSSGVIFSVSDIAGLPLIEADASGDVKLIEFGRYVGVGTGTPEYQLDVFGTGRFSEGIIFPDGNRQTIAYTGGGGGGGSSPTGTASGVAFFGGDNNLTESTKFIFDSGNGRLGVGPGVSASDFTSNNLVRFTKGKVTGGANAFNSTLTVEHGDSHGINIISAHNRGGRIYFSDTSAGRGEIEYQHNGDHMNFKTSATERVRIDSAGNVSIGDTGNNGQLYIVNDTASDIGLTVQGAAAQSANLQEWQNSAGTVLADVDNSGNISGNSIFSANHVGTTQSTHSSRFNAEGRTFNLQWSENNGALYNNVISFNGAASPKHLLLNPGDRSDLDIKIFTAQDDPALHFDADQDLAIFKVPVNIVGNVDVTGSITSTATGIFTSGIQFGDGTVQTTAATGGGGGGSTSPGGSNTQIQFNNAGSFGGDANFTWDYNTDALTVSGSTLISNTGTVFEVTNTGGTTLFAVEDSDEVQVIVAKQVGQTGNPFEVRDEFDVAVASINISGNISGNNIIFGDGTIQTTAAGGGGGGSTTGTASGVAFFGNDNNLTESTSFTFDSGNKILNVFGTGTEYGTLKLGQNARWVSRNGTAISYQSSATNFPVLFNAHHSVVLASNVDFGWSSNSSDPFGATTDTIVSRDAAGTVGFYKSGGSTYGTINVGNMVIDNPTSSNVNLVVKGAASQSANLQEWQNSAGLTKASVDQSGSFEGYQGNFSGLVHVKLADSYYTTRIGAGHVTLGSNVNLSANATYLSWDPGSKIASLSHLGGNGLARLGGSLSTNAAKISTYSEGHSSYPSHIIFTSVGGAETFKIDNAGNTTIVSGLTVGQDADISGALTATTKSFLIDHPTKEGMKLQYGSLEGPENGVYVRGTTDLSTIELPDYWVGLVDENSITVSLTPIGSFQQLYVEDKNSKQITVGGVWGSYDYVVYAERKDVDKLEVEW